MFSIPGPRRCGRLLMTTPLFAPATMVAGVTSLAVMTAHSIPASAQSATEVPSVTVVAPKPKPKQRFTRAQPRAQRIAPGATPQAAPAVPAPTAPPLSPATPDGISRLAAIIGSSTLPANDIASKRASTSDTATLLSDAPGVSLYGAGGVSSLPAIHGLADDRLRIKVDGMDLVASCPNHMNPALSYIDPSHVGAVKVWAGVTPVSVGGDSIGGTIVVDTEPPAFAAPGQGVLTKGEIGAFYRSNGNVLGANFSATAATDNFSITYDGAAVKAENYNAGGAFKRFAPVTYAGAPFVSATEVGSTAYQAANQLLTLAWKNDSHLIELKIGQQHIPEQLYPNQRMDMLGNTAYNYNFRHLGEFEWGELDTRVYYQTVDHYMNFGSDKLLSYGTLTPPNTTGGSYPVIGMPMYAKAKTIGASSKANINVTSRDVLRVGFDLQAYRLDDWWPPAPDCGVGNCIGGMAPLTFWNINDGKRDRFAGFGEWEAKWSPTWLSLVGLRYENVETNTGPVVGYNTSTTPLTFGMLKTMYETSSVGSRDAFNNMDRGRSFDNFDLTALLRYTPNTNVTLEFGLAQKMRSPNLYELYSWSRNVMALEMNNFVGDGNGYLGNPYLKSELAHTVSFTAEWQSADRETAIRFTPYFTHVDDYIDAVQWNRTTNLPANPLLTNQFVVMKYMNQEARLYGFDLSGRIPLGKTSIGDFWLKGLINYTNGTNLETDDGLYNIMPLNSKFTLNHKWNDWESGIELASAADKTDVSSARNELRLPGYSLVNLRSNYTWNNWRFSFGIENLLNKTYYLPLGGAYVGEGATMSFNREAGNNNSTMWGTGVAGPGRSFYVGANYKF